MELTFLGTRGYIEHRSRRHRWHSSLLVAIGDRRVMIDCGLDWRDRLTAIAPHAVVVTHAHPDHAWGLQGGAPCPVYASGASWEEMADYPLEDRRVFMPRRPFEVEGITVEAFAVTHSLRAPAVGLRLSGEGVTLFYVPDVVDIQDRAEALRGAALFIGDGATIRRSLVRRRDGKLFGHTTVRAQLGWCHEAGVGRAVFTHCGSEIVTGDERKLGAEVRALGRERGVEARIAYDGLQLALP